MNGSCAFGARLLAVCALAVASTSGKAATLEMPTLANVLAETRAHFTIDGKPIPPEIFVDFGDADMADSRPILIAIEALAAMDSNRYADPINKSGAWVRQTRANEKTINGAEETAYSFVGTTANHLIVVIASYNGGGSGTFHTLHILDSSAASAFGDDGKIYARLELRLLRSIALGDRWQGRATIAGNAIHVMTTAGGGERGLKPLDIEARRP